MEIDMGVITFADCPPLDRPDQLFVPTNCV